MYINLNYYNINYSSYALYRFFYPYCTYIIQYSYSIFTIEVKNLRPRQND